MFPRHDGNHTKQQRRKPALKTQTTRNHSIHSKIMDPPATAESVKSPAMETIKTKQVSCHDGNHKQKTAETINTCFLPRRKP